MVLREGDITIKIQKEPNPCFDFYHYDPFYELKFNTKTKSIILKTLGSCKVSEGGFTWYRNNRLYVNLEIINCDQILILLFRYTVARESRNYYYDFASYSFYTVAKALYVIKNPFYLIESKVFRLPTLYLFGFLKCRNIYTVSPCDKFFRLLERDAKNFTYLKIRYSRFFCF